VVKQGTFYYPPKDVDQEVERKLLGSMEKSERGSYTTSAKCEEEASVAIRIGLLLEWWRRWVCGGWGCCWVMAYSQAVLISPCMADGQNATDGRHRSPGLRRPVNEDNLCGRVAQLHRKFNESQKRRNERRENSRDPPGNWPNFPSSPESTQGMKGLKLGA